jgi:hypothetical protein
LVKEPFFEKDFIMGPPSDQRKDVEALLIPFIREAHCQAEAVVVFLKAMGLSPSPEGRPKNPVSFAPDLLWKIAAFMRLYQWEKIGLYQFLPANLPSSREVFKDILEGGSQNGGPRFSGEELAKTVMWVYLTQLAWDRWPGMAAEVAIAQAVSPDQALDLVAQFLWQFRNLSQGGSSS